MLRLQTFRFCMIFFMFCTSASAQYKCDFESNLPAEASSFPSGSFECTKTNTLARKQSLAHVFDSQTSAQAYFTAKLPEIELNTNDVSWQFKIRYGYMPSQSNHWSIFLTSDKAADQLAVATGFAIGVNANSTYDKLKLYWVEKGKYNTLISSDFNWEKEVGITAAPLISVNRKADGSWIIAISVNGNSASLNQITQGTVSNLSSALYWGIQYQFTKDQDRKLWLDDFCVDWKKSDNPPHLPTDTPSRYDVIISELMPDPEPIVGLPAFEYIELFNRSVNDINLKNWTIAIGKNTYTLPELTLKADSFLLISTAEGAIALSKYGKSLGLLRSKTSLSNEGSMLVLRNEYGQTIDATLYSANNLKGSEGGHSIVSKRTVLPCLTTNYWKLSSNTLGGTPGQKELFQSATPTPLTIQKTFISDNSTIHLLFNQSVDSTSAINAELYQFSDQNTKTTSISVVPPFFQEVILKLNKDLETNEILEINIKSAFCNCDSISSGQELTTRIALPEKAEQGDIILSEIRFEPMPGFPEFIEIQNISNKVIDAGTLKLNVISSSGKITEANLPSSQLLFPNEYVAYYSGKDSLTCTASEKFQTWETMPNLTSDEGTIELRDTLNHLFEKVRYNQDWQFVLLSEKRGHSLERISTQLPSEDGESWQTSANVCGTPGMPNSQQVCTNNKKTNLSLSAESFGKSPGLEPTVMLNINDLPVGGMVNIQLFDASGRHVKWLARNILAGNNFSTEWNGTDDSSSELDTNIYIIFARWIHPKGKVIELKKTVVWVKN